MPSPRNPATVVNPGPGLLPDSVLTASAYIFHSGGGGGSDAALEAHIHNPIDAHMASAIGVNPTDPVTGQPILSIAGGPVDGESVLDFIESAMDLFPVRPDTLGTEQIGVPNSGIPAWGKLDREGLGTGTAKTGGFTRGTNMVYTHYMVPALTTTCDLSGMDYPADRGVLALYFCTEGDFVAGDTTLVSALFLGVNPPPVGIPGAAFIETSRRTGQLNHSPAGGLDLFSFTNRLPYLSDYNPYGAPYADFTSNFYRYQLGTLGDVTLPIAFGNAGSYLLVHWRESYATSLALIQPSVLITALSTTNCYSAIPSAPMDMDHGDVATLCRHNVFRNNRSVGQSVSIATVLNPGGTTTYLSGVQFYDNVTPLTWTLTVQSPHLFNGPYYTGTHASADLPADFLSERDPIVVDLTSFGATTDPAAYYQLSDASGAPVYSLTNPPLITDTAWLERAAQGVTGATEYSPVDGFGQVAVVAHTPFNGDVTATDTFKYLYNSCPQTGSATHSTATYEPFDDEKYRYDLGANFELVSKPIIPVGADHRDSAVIITLSDADAQVIGSQVTYPHEDFTAIDFSPTGPDYAAVWTMDFWNYLRRYVRAFNTGLPRNTGKIRLQGISYNDILSTVANPSTEIAGHTGRVLVQIKVPGATGWLDVGRDYGLPDLNVAVDFRGCKTGIAPTDPTATDFELSYCTGTAFTADNRLGAFLLWVRVTLVKPVSGSIKPLDSITWLAP